MSGGPLRCRAPCSAFSCGCTVGPLHVAGVACEGRALCRPAQLYSRGFPSSSPCWCCPVPRGAQVHVGRRFQPLLPTPPAAADLLRRGVLGPREPLAVHSVDRDVASAPPQRSGPSLPLAHWSDFCAVWEDSQAGQWGPLRPQLVLAGTRVAAALPALGFPISTCRGNVKSSPSRSGPR